MGKPIGLTPDSPGTQPFSESCQELGSGIRYTYDPAGGLLFCDWRGDGTGCRAGLCFVGSLIRFRSEKGRTLGRSLAMEGTRLSETVQKRAKRVDALRWLQGQTRRMRATRGTIGRMDAWGCPSGAWRGFSPKSICQRKSVEGNVWIVPGRSGRVRRDRLWQLSAHLDMPMTPRVDSFNKRTDSELYQMQTISLSRTVSARGMSVSFPKRDFSRFIASYYVEDHIDRFDVSGLQARAASVSFFNRIKKPLFVRPTRVCSSSRSLSSAACPLFIDVEIHQFPRVPQVEILAGKTPKWIKSGICSTVKEMHSPLSPHQLQFYKP